MNKLFLSFVVFSFLLSSNNSFGMNNEEDGLNNNPTVKMNVKADVNDIEPENKRLEYMAVSSAALFIGLGTVLYVKNIIEQSNEENCTPVHTFIGGNLCMLSTGLFAYYLKKYFNN